MIIYVVTPYCLQGKYDYELVNVQFMRRFAKKETIVDNGVFEFFHIMKRSVDFDKVVEKQWFFLKNFDKVKIVLPDVPKNWRETKRLVDYYLDKYDFDCKKLIGVVQCDGVDVVDDVLKYYEGVGIEIVAIPIKLRVENPKIVDAVVSSWEVDKIHFLGFDLSDISIFQKYGFVFRSIDTSYPIKCKMLGLKFGEDAPRPIDYFERNVEYVDVEGFWRWLNERVGGGN